MPGAQPGIRHEVAIARVWGWSLQPPKANGGQGGEAPSCRKLRVWSGALSARRFLRFFNKNNALLGIFRLKFCLKQAPAIAKKG